jgi:hypothetical protein
MKKSDRIASRSGRFADREGSVCSREEFRNPTGPATRGIGCSSVKNPGQGYNNRKKACVRPRVCFMTVGGFPEVPDCLFFFFRGGLSPAGGGGGAPPPPPTSGLMRLLYAFCDKHPKSRILKPSKRCQVFRCFHSSLSRTTRMQFGKTRLGLAAVIAGPCPGASNRGEGCSEKSRDLLPHESRQPRRICLLLQPRSDPTLGRRPGDH